MKTGLNSTLRAATADRDCTVEKCICIGSSTSSVAGVVRPEGPSDMPDPKSFALLQFTLLINLFPSKGTSVRVSR